MNEQLKRLIEERNRVVVEIRSAFEKADTENKGVLREEDHAAIAALEVRESDLMKSIDVAQRQVDREKSLKQIANGNSPVGLPAGQGAPESKDQELRMRFFRSLLIDGPAEAQRNPEFRDLVAGTLTQGGSFIAPQTFMTEVLKAVDNNLRIRQYARVIPLTQSVSLGVPTIDSNPSDADWTTELATGSRDTGLKTGKRELVPTPVAKRLLVSNKLLQVSAIPVEQTVKERLEYIMGVTGEKAYLTGDGASKPLGLYTANANGISTGRDVSTGNTTTAITFDGLINALYSLKEQYQAKAVWNFHRDAIKQLRLVKDGNGQYVWAAGGQAGEPDSVLGKPMFQSEYSPNTFTTGKYVGLVGDFKFYWIVDVLAVTMQKLVELYAETNQVGWIVRFEGDGMPVLEEAFARVKLA